MQRSDRRLRRGCLDHHSVHAREYRCDVQHRQQSQQQVGKFEATCAGDKTAHGATCTVTPDAGHSGGSLTCNGVTGAYDAVASTTTACTPANWANSAANKFTATCGSSTLSHGATCDLVHEAGFGFGTYPSRTVPPSYHAPGCRSPSCHAPSYHAPGWLWFRCGHCVPTISMFESTFLNLCFQTR